MTTKTLNMNTIKAGDVVKVSYDGHTFPAPSTFLGFTNTEKKYSEVPKFDTLAEAKGYYSVSKNSDLEEMGDKLNYLGHGYGVYAVFRDEEDKTVWTAYLFQGRWALGSSADYFKVEAVTPSDLWAFDLGPVPAGYAEVEVNGVKGLHYQGC